MSRGRWRKQWRWALAVSAVSIAAPVALVGATVEPANADYMNPQYSLVLNDQGGGYYTGIRASRPDDQIAWNNGNCGYTNQDEWLLVANQPDAWLEFGTQHYCNGAEVWFAAYGYNGTFYPLTSVQINGSANHDFWLYRLNDGSGNQYWEWQIDATGIYGPWANGWHGYQAQEGMETWDSTPVWGWQTYDILWSGPYDQEWSSFYNDAPYNQPLTCVDMVNGSSTVVNHAENEGC
jgi:hypothetical protein